ncbi:hypothetical protein PPOP_1114 [Paenibacillus popilliae ATCC 14706]|uniref:Uncharacterized protein n=2 Tax=Paenibacillus popilliae TaxID=78057 RepID=M9M3I4_PAEPP|nr:hypothetical protein PPOP_1114 [Paenibacillus popilliae ATCC 14706]
MVVCSLVVSLAGVSYASPGQVEVEPSYSVDQEKRFIIHKEDYTTYVTYHEIPQTLDIQVVDQHTGETVFEEHGASIGTVLSWLEKPAQGNRHKRFVFVIPLAWGAAEIAAAIVSAATVTTGIALTVNDYEKAEDSVYYNTKKEIEDAATAIPKKLKKDGDDYTVDLDKFNQKVKSKTSVKYKDPDTGWLIEKNRCSDPHKGDKWKLYKGKKRIASLTAEGKIVGK